MPIMAGGELEPRVSALENEVRELKARVRGSEQDAAAARVLAGAADRDVGDIRGELRDFRQATVASFNAMREDFVALRGDVEGLRGEMRSKFDMAAAGQQQIVTLLETLIDRGTGSDGG
jgi:hypothetical protein